MNSAAVPNPIRANRRVLAAAMIGSAVEYYDFFVYGTAAALVFGQLFFPSQTASQQTMLSLLTFGAAFVARPVGAVAFGHFGDRFGRKTTLVFALLLMGLSTLLIAFLPTYAMAESWGAGWLAPLLLTMLRFGQGLGLGGEWGGAALLAIENAPKGWRARFGAVPQLGAPVGMIMANGLFMVLGATLTKAEFLAWGWRLPFLLSAVLVGLGLWIRMKISETPAFQAALAESAPPRVPLISLMRSHFGAVIGGSAGVIATFAAFYLTTVFALSQAKSSLGYDPVTFQALQLGANVCYAIGIVWGARRADEISPAHSIATGAMALAVFGFAFGPGLSFYGMWVAGLTVSLGMLVLGFNNAALGPWLSQLFPVQQRYSGTSLSFNFGGLIGGAVSPLVAQQIASGGHPGLTGLLLTLGGAITFIGVKTSRAIYD